MNKSNVSFYGYNDSKAMTIYTCIMLFVPTVISFCLSIIVSIVRHIDYSTPIALCKVHFLIFTAVSPWGNGF